MTKRTEELMARLVHSEFEVTFGVSSLRLHHDIMVKHLERGELEFAKKEFDRGQETAKELRKALDEYKTIKAALEASIVTDLLEEGL